MHGHKNLFTFMKKFEKELLFSQVEGETTTGSGNGSTGENAGEGENDAP